MPDSKCRFAHFAEPYQSDPTQLRNCPVCGAAIEAKDDEYCSSHTAALRNVKEAYATWTRAFGGLTTEQFLARIIALAETGNRVKELADYFAKDPLRWKGSGL